MHWQNYTKLPLSRSFWIAGKRSTNNHPTKGPGGLKEGRIYWWGRASIRIRPPRGYQAGVDSQVWVGKGEGVASGVGTISESACVGAASQVERSTGSEHRKPAWEGALWFYHPASPMAACFTSYPFYCYTFSLSARIQWISSVLFFFVKTAPCYVIRALASNLKWSSWLSLWVLG